MPKLDIAKKAIKAIKIVIKSHIPKRPEMMPSIEGFSAVHPLEHFEGSSAINSGKEKAETAIE